MEHATENLYPVLGGIHFESKLLWYSVTANNTVQSNSFEHFCIARI